MSHNPVSSLAAVLRSPDPTLRAVALDLGGGLGFEALVFPRRSGEGDHKPSPVQSNDGDGTRKERRGGVETKPLPDTAISGETEGG